MADDGTVTVADGADLARVVVTAVGAACAGGSDATGADAAATSTDAVAALVDVVATRALPAAATAPDAAVRAIAVDQTHRSFVVGESVIVKIGGTVGALDHGVAQALALVDTGLTPDVLGWAVATAADGRRWIAVTVTAFVPAAQDGWTWAVNDVLAAVGDEPGGPDPAWPAQLGRMTAELHAAVAARGAGGTSSVPLAGTTAVSGMGQPVATVADAGSATGPVAGPTTGPAAGPAIAPTTGPAARARATAALDAALEATSGEVHRRLAARVDAIAAAIASLPDHPASAAIPVHGDLHVGQVLRSVDGRLWLVDLDGDPQLGAVADHAARDLAHLLVSVDMVAAIVQRLLGRVDRPVQAWAGRARHTMLVTYTERLAELGVPELLDPLLLPGFEAEQIVRELLYAARYLPRWTYAGDAAVTARFEALPRPCGRCDDASCGSQEEEPWTPPRSAATSS